jgi:hypothetical protein
MAARTEKQRFPTLGELTEMSADELRGQDMTVLNLRCAPSGMTSGHDNWR